MSKRIMIVEDEGILRVGTTLQLMSLGFEVVGYFQSGEEAIKQVKKMDPDLILMDIQLAGDIDGIETVKQIQQLIDVPVVYLSAYSDHDLIEEAETTNPFRYLVKPLDEMELKFTIETAIDSHEKDKKVKIQDEVLNNLNGIMYRYFVQDNILTVINGSFDNILRYNEDELEFVDGHFLKPFIVDDDQEIVFKTLNYSLNLKIPFKLDYRIKNKNDKIYHFQEIGKPILGDEDEICYIDGIIFVLNNLD